MAAGEGEGEAIKLFGKTITLDRRQVKKEEQGRITAEQMAEKRPDKIIPCPRCKSMETKFCYFNNYNVNQPRHFCRGCQRYWTAGGALRDVPVGAGRRKTKPPGLSLGGFHQIELDGVVLEDWQVAAYGGFRYVHPGKRLKSRSGQNEDQ